MIDSLKSEAVQRIVTRILQELSTEKILFRDRDLIIEPDRIERKDKPVVLGNDSPDQRIIGRRQIKQVSLAKWLMEQFRTGKYRNIRVICSDFAELLCRRQDQNRLFGVPESFLFVIYFCPGNSSSRAFVPS